MDSMLQRHLSRIYKRDSRDWLNDKVKRQVKLERISFDGDILSYVPDDAEHVGVYIAAEPVRPDCNYFEIEILDSGMIGNMTVGLVSTRHSLDQQPGWMPESIGYHGGDGRLYKGSPKGLVFGPKCETGDRMGCGIKFDHLPTQDNQRPVVPVFFTKNGKEWP